MSHIYVQPFKNVCSVYIPQRVHFFLFPCLDYIVDDTVPPKDITEHGVFSFDAFSSDVRITFPIAMSGKVFLKETAVVTDARIEDLPITQARIEDASITTERMPQ